MEFPSSGKTHALRTDEYDTSAALAHARRQADEKRFSEFTIVDVDSHIDESMSFRAIINEMESDVLQHFVRGSSRAAIPFNLDYEDAAGRLPRFAAAKLEKVPDNILRDVAIANRRMDAMGVDLSCVLPTAVLRLAIQPRRDMELEFAFAYNRWLTEVLLPQAPRLRGMLYLPFCDAAACYRTIKEFGEKRGVVGALVVSESYLSVHHNSVMRTYKEMEERRLALAFHSGVNWYDRISGQSNRYLALKALGGPQFNAIHLANWIVNGLPERFPRLKVLWMESGIAWAPALIARLNSGYMARSFDAPLLKRLPGDYMRDMFYCSQPLERFEDMELLEGVFRSIGADTQLVWGSNYPHSDFDLPSVIYDLPFLTREAKVRILGQNAVELFKLEI
jgi:predicted TIM-barrel fold metal-dependent hydrolase